MPVLNDILKIRLETQEKAGLKRHLSTHAIEFLSPITRHEGRDYLHFSGNDYLGLRTHPHVMQAAMAAIDIHGAGAGASRLVLGNHKAFGELEIALAAYKGTESALVFGSGYLANIGAITALVEQGDLILADKFVHACMLDGAQLSGATVKRFAHNDMGHLTSLLATHRSAHSNCLILTESVFSMDGDCAPIAEIQAIAQSHDAWLMVDDAHGLGFVKPFSADVISGTLSKALGSYGGYVAGSSVLMQHLISQARSFIFSTGLPASCVTAANAALNIMKSSPELALKAQSLANRIRKTLGQAEGISPIIPLIIGTPEAALEASYTLREAGIWIQAIRPPTVPPGTSRLRITVSASHTEDHIVQLLDALQTIKKTL